MYGPKSGSFRASIPGAPFGFPGPGLPTLPPLPALPGENLPPVELPLGEKLGDGEYLLPEPEDPELEPEPVLEPAIGPPDGPATFGAATFGAGMLKFPPGFLVFGALGLIAGFGAEVGAFGTPCGVGALVVFLGAHGSCICGCCF